MNPTSSPPQLQPIQSPTLNPAKQSHAANTGDDDLTPSERASRAKTSKGISGKQNSVKPRWRSARRPLLIAAALLLGVTLWPWQATESGARNWSHVEHANRHWAATQDEISAEQEPVKWITKMGPAEFTNVIVVSQDDIDQTGTEAVREALIRGDYAAADAALQNAQTGLDGVETAYAKLTDPDEPSPAVPTLTPGMRTEIMRGDSNCFHIFLFDSCAQDGDIVDIVINGTRFATVPITNAGTTLSVPVSSSYPTTIAIRGVWDGGGGITVACETSEGQGFVRVMQTGEEQPLGIVGR